MNWFIKVLTDLFENIPQTLLSIPVILIALSVHECAHGWVAYKCGDPTAKNAGRLTLNPLKHIDPVGAICMFLFHFGWAKPVPIHTRYFKNRKRDTALTAVAGPISNILLGFLALILFRALAAILTTTGVIGVIDGTSYIFSGSGFVQGVINYSFLFLNLLFTMNVYLAVFNLLPIPPLDGSRLLFLVLPDRYYYRIIQYEQVIYFLMLILLWTRVLTMPLTWLMGYVTGAMEWVVNLIPFL